MSCKPKPPADTEGQDWRIFLNTHDFLRHELKLYGAMPIKFVDVVQKKYADSSYLNAMQVDWAFYIQPFLKVNICDSTNQGLYKYDQVIDTVTKTATLTYLPLYSGLPLQKMIVGISTINGDVQNVYAEHLNQNLWSSNLTKMMYLKGSIIQIIESSQPRIGKAKNSIRKLVFKLPHTTANSVILQ
jgi:hypothetical protein